jgi:hypothetical protein
LGESALGYRFDAREGDHECPVLAVLDELIPHEEVAI